MAQVHVATLTFPPTTRQASHTLSHLLTDEVVWIEEIIVPDLHGEDGRKMALRLCQAVEVFLLLDNHHVLCREILHREHKPPVEVTLSVHRTIMNVCLLSIIFSTKPATQQRRGEGRGNTETLNYC